MGFKQHISRTWQMIEQQVNDVPFRPHDEAYRFVKNRVFYRAPTNRRWSADNRCGTSAKKTAFFTDNRCGGFFMRLRPRMPAAFVGLAAGRVSNATRMSWRLTGFFGCSLACIARGLAGQPAACVSDMPRAAIGRPVFSVHKSTAMCGSSFIKRIKINMDLAVFLFICIHVFCEDMNCLLVV